VRLEDPPTLPASASTRIEVTTIHHVCSRWLPRTAQNPEVLRNHLPDISGIFAQVHANLDDAIGSLIERGVVVVAATGNDGSSGYSYPAGMPNVIGVASTDENVMPALLDAARCRATLARLGISNVEVHHADGSAGWPVRAPYDVIVVSAAAEGIPQPLLDQLAEGGRLVIPVVTSASAPQDLLLVHKRGGKLEKRTLFKVLFVPLVEGTT